MANFCSGVKVRLFGGAAGSMSSSVTSSFWARSIKGVELVKVMVSVLPVSPWREERLRQVSHVSLTDRASTTSSTQTDSDHGTGQPSGCSGFSYTVVGQCPICRLIRPPLGHVRSSDQDVPEVSLARRRFSADPRDVFVSFVSCVLIVLVYNCR